MKKKTLFRNSMLLLTAAVCFAACRSNTTLNHEDTLKIQQIALDRIFGKTAGERYGFQPHDKRVPTSSIAKCVTDYDSHHPKSDPNATWAVGFHGDSLKAWISEVTQNPNIRMDSIRIVFGNYTAPFLATYGGGADPQSHHPGRLTVFLCPYYKGQPAKYITGTIAAKTDSTVDSFNLGSLYP